MNRSTLLFAPLAAALAFGATLAAAAPTTSPFAGTWSGTFEDVTNGGEGTMELSIADNGVVSGSYLNTTTGGGAAVHGQIKDDGRWNNSGFQGTVSLVGGNLVVDAVHNASDTNIIATLAE